MASHYLTILEIGEHFSKHISKKELDMQAVGTTITLNCDQITIIDDPRYSILGKPDPEDITPADKFFEYQ